MTDAADAISSNRSLHPMLLAFTCNGAYAMRLATMLRSGVEHNAAHGPIEIHVLVEQFSQTLRKRVVASRVTTCLRPWCTVNSTH